MIRQPTLFFLSLLFLVVVLGFAFDRIMFMRSAVRTSGVVEDVRSHNGRCGGKRRYSCTKYEATIRFSPISGGPDVKFETTAGSKRGSNQPISGARFSVGSSIPVIYSAKHPKEAYYDSIWEIWGTPLYLLVMQLATLFGSMTESRRRTLLT